MILVFPQQWLSAIYDPQEPLLVYRNGDVLDEPTLITLVGSRGNKLLWLRHRAWAEVHLRIHWDARRTVAWEPV